MKTSRVIELTEEDVNAAILSYIKDKLSGNETSQSITYITGVRGDYDKGDAREYVRKVIIGIDE